MANFGVDAGHFSSILKKLMMVDEAGHGVDSPIGKNVADFTGNFRSKMTSVGAVWRVVSAPLLRAGARCWSFLIKKFLVKNDLHLWQICRCGSDRATRTAGLLVKIFRFC